MKQGDVIEQRGKPLVKVVKGVLSEANKLKTQMIIQPICWPKPRIPQ